MNGITIIKVTPYEFKNILNKTKASHPNAHIIHKTEYVKPSTNQTTLISANIIFK